MCVFIKYAFTTLSGVHLVWWDFEPFWKRYSRSEWWTVAKVLFEICIRRLGLYFVLKFYQIILSTSCDFRLFVYKIYQWTVANSYRGANFNFSLTKTAWNQRIVFEINFENG